MSTKVLKLFLSQLIIALGIALVINSGLGAFPITLCNLSISNLTGLSFGFCSMLVELIVIIICSCFKMPISIATLFNGLLGGYFIDFVLLFLPIPVLFPIKLLYVILGAITLIYGFYKQGSLGLGKTSSNLLTSLIRKKTQASITSVKTIQECLFVLIGLIGASSSFGLATIILSLGFGKLMDYIYTKLNYDPTKVKHQTIEFQKHHNYELLLNHNNYKLQRI